MSGLELVSKGLDHGWFFLKQEENMNGPYQHLLTLYMLFSFREHKHIFTIMSFLHTNKIQVPSSL